MPYILTTTSSVMCPHGGRAILTTSNTHPIDGTPALLATEVHAVVGCPFATGPKPSPCVQIRWLAGFSTCVFVNGVPVLLSTSTGICLSVEGIPQGPPMVAVQQVISEAR